MLVSCPLTLGRVGTITYRTVVEPPKHEVIIPLHRHSISFGSTVGLEVIAAVLESNPSPAFELFMIPFSDLSMRKKRMMTARKPRLHALRHIVIKRQVSPKGII